MIVRGIIFHSSLTINRFPCWKKGKYKPRKLTVAQRFIILKSATHPHPKTLITHHQIPSSSFTANGTRRVWLASTAHNAASQYSPCHCDMLCIHVWENNNRSIIFYARENLPLSVFVYYACAAPWVRGLREFHVPHIYRLGTLEYGGKEENLKRAFPFFMLYLG